MEDYQPMNDRELTRLFVIISICVVFAAGGWVWSTWHFGQNSLEALAAERGQQLRRTYDADLERHTEFVLETAGYIARDPAVRKLFDEGARAVAEDDSAAAARARSELLAHVEQSWRNGSARQAERILHFHTPPATSFLRVHAPDKFGDDLSGIRGSVVKVNTSKKPASGFETGRYFTGIRAVTPVFTGPDNDDEGFIGALEIGLPLATVLDDLTEQVQADFAILFDLDHLKTRMPADYFDQYTKDHRLFDDFALTWISTEAPSNSIIAKELELYLADLRSSQSRQPPSEGTQPKHDGSTQISTEVSTEISTDVHTHLLDDWRLTRGVTLFPLRELQTSDPATGEPAGVVIAWFSLEEEVAALHDRVMQTLLVALFVVLAVEAVLYTGLMRERDLRIERNASLTDALTGIANRRHFEETLDQEVRRATRSLTPVAVILCDIDLFKQYNDFYGHPAGDECIRQVAKALQNSLRRAGDFVARYGGEEFIAILPDTNLDSAALVAERLRKAVQALGLAHEKHPLGVATISVGVTAAQVHSNGAGETLIATADEALYQAKEAGRNCVRSLKFPGATSMHKHAIPITYR